MFRHAKGAVALLLAGCLALPAVASDGVTADSVSFAQVAALDGPAAALGLGMKQGLDAAFAEANAAGGINGRKIVLDSFNDSYEPDQSAAEVSRLIAEGTHLGLIGLVGTPTTSATQPIATAAGVPYIGPFTGAGFLRDAALTNVLNVRASYAAETEDWIRYLVDVQGMKNIAILYQDDGFGRVGFDGVTAALGKRGMTLSASGTYTRNTTAVKSALIDIRAAAPDAVVMVGAYKPIAEFIRLSHKLDFAPTFVNISFVGSSALAGELGADGEGVIISQVVPFPWDDSLPVVARYQAAMQAVQTDATFDFVSLEGYIVGRLAIEAVRAAGQDLTRAGLIAAMQGMTDVDIDGLKMSFGAGDNQGLEDVFLTRIVGDGTFAQILD